MTMKSAKSINDAVDKKMRRDLTDQDRQIAKLAAQRDKLYLANLIKIATAIGNIDTNKASRRMASRWDPANELYLDTGINLVSYASHYGVGNNKLWAFKNHWWSPQSFIDHTGMGDIKGIPYETYQRHVAQIAVPLALSLDKSTELSVTPVVLGDASHSTIAICISIKDLFDPMQEISCVHGENIYKYQKLLAPVRQVSLVNGNAQIAPTRSNQFWSAVASGIGFGNS